MLVPMHPLAALVALLGLDRQGGDRSGLQALQRDRLARLLAEAVRPFVDAGQGGVDLGDELALPIAGAKLDRAIGFRGRPIGEIGMVLVLALQVPLASCRMSFFQPDSLRRKYSLWRSFMKGSSSVGRYPSSMVVLAIDGPSSHSAFAACGEPIGEASAVHNGLSCHAMVDAITKRSVAAPSLMSRSRP